MTDKQPLDRRNLLQNTSYLGEAQCTARSKRTGERCRAASMMGGNVCRVHGGAAPQTRAKAKRRLEQAADALVQRLLQFALDGRVDDNVALHAIRDALDRAGLGAKAALELSVAEPRPWEDIMGDLAGVASITRAESRARRGLPDDTPAPAEPYEVVDAELVDEPDAPEMPSSSTGDTRTGDEPSRRSPRRLRTGYAPRRPR